MQPPQIRSLLATWLLTIFSGGLYLPFWAWQVANELNFAEGRRVFNVGFWRTGLIVCLLLTLAGFLYALNSDNPVAFFVVFLLMLGLILHVQLSIGNYIKAKDKELNTGASFSNAMSIVLLWCVANTGVAYMQAGINRIIAHERARRADPPPR